MTLPEVLQRVVSVLTDESVPYMVTGSFAAAYYAHPRATQDIDLVVEATQAQLLRVATRLREADLYVSDEAIREAVEHESQFSAIDVETGWKVDFIVRKSRPFSVSEFGRRTQAEVFGLDLSLASPEDLVIAKLEWAKAGDRSYSFGTCSASWRPWATIWTGPTWSDGSMTLVSGSYGHASGNRRIPSSVIRHLPDGGLMLTRRGISARAARSL